ncbi:hypothetical protein [Caballeronia sp. INDeC2]|uniref:hypothetical protein n=1 Tax=Caballeronia sp. INDeC2 TaxID=2921747 RepID=UPI002028539B|nr:hypothetical protein [Caballeronia sp. INDeC2]
MLRQQLTSTERHSVRAKKNSDLPRADASAEDAAALLHKIAELKRLDIVDQRQLNRMVVELVLDREFGHALRNDPQFQQMVDDVTTTLTGSEDFNAALIKLLN